jgi:acylphosphatase
MMQVALHVRVTGLVQGVFFRAWARDEAQALGVSGWIRNCSDGSVEALVEGEAEAIEELIDLLREGPPGAQVEDVEIEEADREGLSSFEVRH